MDTFARDLRYAVRALLRMRGVAVVAILTLALGIGATTTMFSVVYARLLRPPPFADPERLVILFNTSVTPARRAGSAALVDAEHHRAAVVGDVVRDRRVVHRTRCSPTSGHGDPEHIEGEVVSPDYFQTLRVAPDRGPRLPRRGRHRRRARSR